MFQFSLQTVLEVRERFEKIKYKEYSQELLQKQEIENEKTEREGSLHRAASNADRNRASSLTTMPLQLHDQFRRRMRDEITLLDERMQEQNEAVEQKRQELVEARRSHKALEILRDKEWKRHQANEARRERAVMDEIASNYHNFRQ